MKATKLRIKTIDELQKLFDEKSTKYIDYELDIRTGKEKDHSKLKYLRKDLARIQTVLFEKTPELSDNKTLLEKKEIKDDLKVDKVKEEKKEVKKEEPIEKAEVKEKKS